MIILPSCNLSKSGAITTKTRYPRDEQAIKIEHVFFFFSSSTSSKPASNIMGVSKTELSGTKRPFTCKPPPFELKKGVSAF